VLIYAEAMKEIVIYYFGFVIAVEWILKNGFKKLVLVKNDSCFNFIFRLKV